MKGVSGKRKSVDAEATGQSDTLEQRHGRHDAFWSFSLPAAARAPLTEKQKHEVEVKRKRRDAVMAVRKAIVRFRHADAYNFGEHHEELTRLHAESKDAMGAEAAKIQKEIEDALLLVSRHLEQPIRVKQELDEMQTLMKEAESTVAEASKVGRLLFQTSGDKERMGEAPSESILDIASTTIQFVEAASNSIAELSISVSEKNASEQFKQLPKFRNIHRRVTICKTALDKFGNAARFIKDCDAESKRLELMRQLINDAIEHAESSVAQASETACQPASFDNVYDISDVAQAKALHFTRAVEIAESAVVDAQKMLNEKVREMRSTLQAVRLNQSDVISGFQDKIKLCKGRLKKLNNTAVLAKKHAERLERIKGLEKEASEALAHAEEMVSEASNVAQPILEDVSDLPTDFTLKIVEATEEAMRNATDAVENARNVLAGKSFMPGQSPEAGMWRKSQVFQMIGDKLSTCTSTLHNIRIAASSGKEQATRTATLERTNEKKMATFTKYDQDGDGMLARQEVAAFALGEYGFNLEEESLSKLFSNVADSEAGVSFQNLQRLRTLISIEKSVAREKQMQSIQADKELGPLCGQIAWATQETMRAEMVTGVQILERLCIEDSMSNEQFLEFIRHINEHCPTYAAFSHSMRSPVVEVEANAIFARLAVGGATISSKKLLGQFAQTLSFQVRRDTLITQDKPVSSAAVRRLVQGELVDAFAGSLPEADTNTGVRRIRCQARKDGKIGWATVSGTQGTTFLEPFSELAPSS